MNITQGLNIYKYMAARMTPENIVPDCMYGWGASEWDFSALKYPADNVLAEMIQMASLNILKNACYLKPLMKLSLVSLPVR